MEYRHLALALSVTLALVTESRAQQGSSQLTNPSGTPLEDPLEGNHSCEYAFDLVPGIYEELSVQAVSPDYFRLFVPANRTLHVDLNVRQSSPDFTVAVYDDCDSEPLLFDSLLIGTIPIELDNDTNEPETYVLRLFRDIGPLTNYAQISYDLMISEGDSGPYPSFCEGDGSTTNCPCANLDPVRGGCAHSGGHGASLLVGGSQFAELGGLSIGVIDMPPQTPALLFSGRLTGEAVLSPFHDGILCLAGGSVVRHGAGMTDVGGRADFSDAYDPSQGRQPGDEVLLQVWYRDPAGPCGTGSNFTQAVRLRVKP
ncbi:MAG: hypothetical protein H6831_12630 [Planctomycetes bacterium]|nr:hypothetical protein [Planctomycetota bacterium]MCB9905245.1 hypothetical protein [Planctomycetota bacterium]